MSRVATHTAVVAMELDVSGAVVGNEQPARGLSRPAASPPPPPPHPNIGNLELAGVTPSPSPSQYYDQWPANLHASNTMRSPPPGRTAGSSGGSSRRLVAFQLPWPHYRHPSSNSLTNLPLPASQGPGILYEFKSPARLWELSRSPRLTWHTFPSTV